MLGVMELEVQLQNYNMLIHMPALNCCPASHMQRGSYKSHEIATPRLSIALSLLSICRWETAQEKLAGGIS